ncbi:MAG: cytochrome c [Gammaproteobacteria bacterium]
MHTKHLILALGITLAALPTSHAADLANGEQLHDGCGKCHGTEVYTREDRRVGDKNALLNQVQRCALALGEPWGNEDVEDVTEYLNANYYKF